MKQKNTIETQNLQPEHLIDMYDDVPIQDVINKLQKLMADGYTHVRGKPKTMYDTPDEYSFAHEMIEELIFSKK